MTDTRTAAPPHFEHDKLDTYVASLDFISLAHEVISTFPRGRHSLADQFERAATSIALNTAEGSGEFSPREKIRFYRMALRSAAECAAILDVASRLGAISGSRERQGKALLGRITGMLTALVRRLSAQP